MVDNNDSKPSAEEANKGNSSAGGDDQQSGNKKNKFRGQNKRRRNEMKKQSNEMRFNNQINGKKLCLSYIANNKCDYGSNCMHSHDLDEYLRLGLRPDDIGDQCYVFDTFGKCPFGITCRFGSKHLVNGSQNVINEDKYTTTDQKTCTNLLAKDLQFSLRKRKYDFSKTQEVLDSLKVSADDNFSKLKSESLSRDRKRVDFAGKLYLAPLTTVGNLPFRRICKRLGADITCGEMAMATNILEGQQSEWALLRRHSSEDIFGVQLCGAHSDSMTRCAQLIQDKCEVDFIDINMGCPIDLVYRKGAGSGLMDRRRKLDEIIYGMSTVTDCPLTLKMRTGVYETKNIAHKVLANVKEWTDRVGLITIHGRSREQRYTKNANWDYIQECALQAQPIPVFGSGDVLGHEEYYERLESGVAGVMIGRGALIKPWIFTEIKERRLWDITANERLDILRDFVNYGLENWGSDDAGVAKTRRFLLEWLSFLHRYIPVGVLERLPQRVNERPPPYVGRSDLETLLSSGSCSDWLKISEMLLGKVPESFVFYPKHKANAY